MEGRLGHLHKRAPEHHRLLTVDMRLGRAAAVEQGTAAVGGTAFAVADTAAAAEAALGIAAAVDTAAVLGIAALGIFGAAS